ncbi:MAG: hypothetical protein WB622_08045 [Acidobacteriaceae bacterium]|jgi:hypothetical protein
MRKAVLSHATPDPRPALDNWLDLERVASAEISSEDPSHPFENALRGHGNGCWRAASPGPQVIRLRFDEPRPLRRIRLEFSERQQRSQEFCLSAIDAANQRRLIARQQWNFSPGGSTLEVEDYSVNLLEIAAIELEIDPGRHDRQAFATLQSLAIA